MKVRPHWHIEPGDGTRTGRGSSRGSSHTWAARFHEPGSRGHPRKTSQAPELRVHTSLLACCAAIWQILFFLATCMFEVFFYQKLRMFCSAIAFNLSLSLSACRFSLLLRAPHYFSCGIGSPVRLGWPATKALYVAPIISIESVPSIDPSNPAWKNHVKW